MLLRQIKYFIKVIEMNSFTVAAEECFISQSAISQQIQALEADLGVELIVRENRKFSLTPAGEYFYKHSLLLLDEAERLKKETREIAGNRNNQLRIGYCMSFAMRELQQTLALFSQRHSETDIQIVYGNHEDLYDYLRNEDVDLIINDQRRALSDAYINYHLCTAYSFIEISSMSPLNKMDFLTIEELRRIPCILIASKEQQENEQDYYQNTLGFNGNFIFAENLEAGRILVAGNKGFMPVESGQNFMQTQIPIRRLPLIQDKSQIQRNYYAFWKKGRDAEDVREFADILRTQLANNEEE
ncbi:LysR family transcriptional regulator [Lacrimispora amygdalina]|uniref:LysR family transcriptional regulator n=1 Tax=Lacrimispora amygdalina TaxID=253257 RepID=UPI000BE46592|nr:LysR family transcriptional regulator [Lacrimispora amygdalina]